MAGIIELLSTIGEDNLKVQSLHTCMETAKYDGKKGETKVTFLTQEPGPMDLCEKKTALIVWMDSDKFNSTLANLNK